MKFFRIMAVIFWLLSAMRATAGPMEDVILESKQLAALQKYTEALTVLSAAEVNNPGNFDLILATTRVLSWSARYEEAEAHLRGLSVQDQRNVDVLLLRADMAFYRSNWVAARDYYQAVLDQSPDYKEAKTGLEKVLKAMQQKSSEQARRWQLDLGYEYSEFARRPQSNWQQEFFQINRFVNAQWGVHFRMAGYDQFRVSDTEYELGADYQARGGSSLYAAVGGAQNPGFRPEYKASGGGAWNILLGGEAGLPGRLTFDGRYDSYLDGTRVLAANPGVSVDIIPEWTLSGKWIVIDKRGSAYAYGRDFKLDGKIAEGVRFFVGYADAPETVLALVVRTESYFAGLAIDVSDSTILRLGYTRDDRNNAYIRRVSNASISYRF